MFWMNFLPTIFSVIQLNLEVPYSSETLRVTRHHISDVTEYLSALLLELQILHYIKLFKT